MGNSSEGKGKETGVLRFSKKAPTTSIYGRMYSEPCPSLNSMSDFRINKV